MGEQHEAHRAPEPRLAVKLTMVFSERIPAYGAIMEHEFTATEMYEGD